MPNHNIEEILKRLFEIIPTLLDERQTRIIAGCIADAYGRGGIKLVCDLSGLNYRTVKAGIDEVNGDIMYNVPYKVDTTSERDCLKC